MTTLATELKHKTFALEYATNGFNGEKAAIAAGYAPRAAAVTASRLLNDDNVQALISAATQPVFDRYGITIENTLKHLAAVAYSDAGDVGVWGTEGGRPFFRPHNSEDMPEMARASVASAKMKAKFHPARYTAKGDLVEEEYWDIEMEVKQHDKVASLNTIAKYLGIVPTTGKVRINVDSRTQSVNFFEAAGLTKEEILAIAQLPLD